MKQRKAQKFEIIEEGTEPYTILTEAREQWHTDLDEADIALAWQSKIKGDVDGHLVLGKCVKVTELYREFAQFDFIIVLNREVWGSPEFTRLQKLALLDHELCHAAPVYDDDTGEQKKDAADRLIWRLRKHDIEEFGSVIDNHGCYKRDLERFAEKIMRKLSAPLLEQTEATETVQLN